jgi:hypothetical protein
LRERTSLTTRPLFGAMLKTPKPRVRVIVEPFMVLHY